MSRVLMVESDRVFAVLLEDALREEGHQVEWAEDEDRALAAAARGRSDLIILDLVLPVIAGTDVVRAIRDQPGGASVPILALSDPLDGPGRVRVLKAGANEVMERPIHMEELLLRAERLTRSGDASPVTLEGRLASYPLWEMLQTLNESSRRGRLLVWNRWGGGRIQLGDRGVTAADWEGLRGGEALLAMLGMEDGSFRFVADSAPPATEETGSPVDARRAVLEAAWIRDEIERRRELLPGTGAALRATGTSPPEPASELPALPVAQILNAVGSRAGTRLFDLLAEVGAAPQRLRLGVAWLIEQGVLTADAEVGSRGGPPPSTLEIAESEVLEAALAEAVEQVRSRGVTVSPIPVLLLAEAGSLAKPKRLFEDLAKRWRSAEMHDFLEQVETRGGGTCLLKGERGEVALHVQELSERSQARLGAIVSVCASVVVWVDTLERPSLLEGVVNRYERNAEAGLGFVVVTRPEASRRIEAVISERGAWRLVSEVPRNLLAILRLIRSGRPAAGVAEGPPYNHAQSS